MKVPIIKIGNSKGIRLPKAILEKYKMVDQVELMFEEEQMVLRPIYSSRKNWEASFQEMNEKGEDALLDNDILGDEPWEEWS